MKSNCLISVIIPIYNVKPYLVECLESVVKQTYDNLEIILIDDGSTDGSGEICDEFAAKDKRIHVFHQNNKGIGYTRNVGLDNMNGTMVAFLDSDDAYDRDFASRMLQTLLDRKSDIVVCKYTEIRSTEKLQRTGKEKTGPMASEGMYTSDDALRALADGFIDPSLYNKLYRRELWDSIRFPEGNIGEDLAAIYRVINNCNNVYVVDQPLYLYRKRPGSISDTITWKNVSDKLMTESLFYAFVERNTPAIFSAKQLRKTKKRKQSCIMPMIKLYLINSKSDSKEENEFSDRALRIKIMDTVKETGIDCCSLRTKLTIMFFISFPHLMKASYPIYRCLRRITGHSYEEKKEN